MVHRFGRRDHMGSWKCQPLNYVLKAHAYAQRIQTHAHICIYIYINITIHHYIYIMYIYMCVCTYVYICYPSPNIYIYIHIHLLIRCLNGLVLLSMYSMWFVCTPTTSVCVQANARPTETFCNGSMIFLLFALFTDNNSCCWCDICTIYHKKYNKYALVYVCASRRMPYRNMLQWEDRPCLILSWVETANSYQKNIGKD